MLRKVTNVDINKYKFNFIFTVHETKYKQYINRRSYFNDAEKIIGKI